MIEIVFSFDTTGSMYPCLTQVRRKLNNTIARLLNEIPGIRIGIIAHGDYCDAGSTYVTKHFDLSGDVKQICNFVETVEATGGGDAPEPSLFPGRPAAPKPSLSSVTTFPMLRLKRRKNSTGDRNSTN
jgi:hypothetical protein